MLDSLTDLAAGDFDVQGSSPGNHGRNGIITVDGADYLVGNLGDGMANAGTGCHGCKGCNVILEKSKIKSELAKPAGQGKRRYDDWDGIGCGGCGGCAAPVHFMYGPYGGYYGPYGYPYGYPYGGPDVIVH